MLKSSGAMAAATLMSRVLGMVREMVYARFMGDGWVAGAFVLAFMIPNLFRRLLGEGALTAAFIPIFKEKEKQEGESEMWRAANVVISGLLIAAGILVVLVCAGISAVLAFGTFEPTTKLMLEILRVVFPYMLLVCVAAMFMAMLNARGLFFLPALGATLLNLVMIPVVLFVAPKWGVQLEEQIFALAFAVLIAGVAQAGFMIPALRKEGFRFRWIRPQGDPVVKEVVAKMIPGMIGVAAFQLNVLLTQSVAFAVDGSIVASYNYAVRLLELPQGIFGVSLATYLLPTLSGLAAEKKFDRYKATLTEGLGYVIFVNALAAVLLVVLAEPIVRLLFERGEFTADATNRVAVALMWLGPGLVPYSLVLILARAFYALGDTQTPMKISALCLGLNLVLVCVLIGPYQQAGMAMANSVTALLNAILLLVALRKRIGSIGLRSLLAMIIQVICAMVLAGAMAWFLHGWWMHRFGAATIWEKIGEVFVPAGLASLAYLFFAFGLKMKVARDLVGMLGRKRGRGT